MILTMVNVSSTMVGDTLTVVGEAKTIFCQTRKMPLAVKTMWRCIKNATNEYTL
jgi:hypothetical protein